MFYRCIKNGKEIVKGDVYEGVRIDSIGSVLAGYYLYCIGVIGKDFLQEVDYKDVVAVKNSSQFALGSKHKGIKVHEPLTHKSIWKIKGSDNEYDEDMFAYHNDVNKDIEILFLDMINSIENGEVYTCGSWSIEKIGESFKITSPNGIEANIGTSTLWKKEKVDAVDFIDAYKHLKDGGSAVSVLSGTRYSFEDIDENDYKEIDIDEIKNKWILA